MTINASGWLQLVLRVSHADAAALVSVAVAEWATDLPQGYCGRTPRAMNATPDRAGQVTVVAPQVGKPGAAIGFSSL